MITIYGIKNCDVMQKAFKWLETNKVRYKFHNYKEDGIDKATIETWLRHLPVDKVINLKSTIYRELPDSEKMAVAAKSKAIELMMSNPSIIKRPLWELGKGKFLLG